MNKQIKRREVGAIEVYNAEKGESEQSRTNVRDTDDSSHGSSQTGFGTCLCCGEDAQTYGMCFQCVQFDCSGDLGGTCRRTGAEDPLGFTEYAFTGGVQL